MPAKSSRKRRQSRTNGATAEAFIEALPTPSPYTDAGLQQTMSSIATLERAIARILLLRFQSDIARLYSSRLYNVSQIYIPQLMRSVISAGGGPGWFIANYDQEDIKDLFRGAISMDLRQAGERTATKSILWSYTALRHFAMSHDVRICKKRGLHSLHLLPYYPQLKAHLDTLESAPNPAFCKPPQLGPLTFGLETVEQFVRSTCSCSTVSTVSSPHFTNATSDKEWKAKIRFGYHMLVDTLWAVAAEFDVRGYGLVLREKLTDKWCDCGCSTDHLGEVCEKTVREDEAESDVLHGVTTAASKKVDCGRDRRKLGKGKEREWDGRGSGVFGWNTLDEEDLWEVELDFGGWDSDHERERGAHARAVDGYDDEDEDPTVDMTISELMEWRYIRAERSKELGNTAFKKADYEVAARYYKCAHSIEPELPHYQLNLAAAHLKLNRWIEAEKACTRALSQHRSTKGYYRRARARRMQGKIEEAARDLRSVLRIQSTNVEALNELAALNEELEERRRHSKAAPKAKGGWHKRRPSDESDVNVCGYQLEQASNVCEASTSSPPHPNTLAMSLGHHIKSAQPTPPDPDLQLTTSDMRRLRVVPLPMSVNVEFFRSSGFGKKRGTKTKEESFGYPSWDRYVVKPV